jgi:DNA invertase Pin-like site-specific DNA recombinase
MGRLTLDVLLSFAQSEREVMGERIRDKIAASKAKGMWMGGVPPLGAKSRPVNFKKLNHIVTAANARPMSGSDGVRATFGATSHRFRA